MSRVAICAVAVAFPAAAALAQESAALRADAQRLISGLGYNCREVTEMVGYGEDEYGTVVKVACNGWATVYRLTVTPAGDVYIKPWD